MIRFVNDWEILDRRAEWNWECFHLIEAYAERDNVCRTLDFTVALLGFGVHGSIALPERWFPPNAVRDELFARVDGLAAEHDGAGEGETE